MKTRSAPTILLLMLSLFENTLCGIDPFDRLKFRLGDGYQVVAHGAIGRLDRLNLLIDTGSIPAWWMVESQKSCASRSPRRSRQCSTVRSPYSARFCQTSG